MTKVFAKAAAEHFLNDGPVVAYQGTPNLLEQFMGMPSHPAGLKHLSLVDGNEPAPKG